MKNIIKINDIEYNVDSVMAGFNDDIKIISEGNNVSLTLLFNTKVISIEEKATEKTEENEKNSIRLHGQHL